jgi:hypothetical protein
MCTLFRCKKDHHVLFNINLNIFLKNMISCQLNLFGCTIEKYVEIVELGIVEKTGDGKKLGK